jgi:hypothetical protein
MSRGFCIGPSGKDDFYDDVVMHDEVWQTLKHLLTEWPGSPQR